MAEQPSLFPPYPWAELYDIESGVKKLKRAGEGKGPGRPKKPIKRLKTSITLTDEEKRIYDRLAYELGSKLHPNKVTKGQVIGLALRLLDEKAQALPSAMRSWERLAEILFSPRTSSRR
jgi:hypothetical protein